MAQFASTLYPQTNPTNPILLSFRERENAGNPHAVRQWLSFMNPGRRYPHGWDGSICPATDKHVDHARRVLHRLASLSG